MKKCAFTLAEVMIFLVVLGIMFSIVYPAMQNIRPDRGTVLMKKAYYTAETVVSELINTPALYPNGFENTEAVTYQGVNYPAGQGKFPALFASKLNITGDISNGKFQTGEGIKWDFSDCIFPGTCSVWKNVKGDDPSGLFRIYIRQNGKMFIDSNYPEAIKAISGIRNLPDGLNYAAP